MLSENGKKFADEILTEFGIIKSEDKKFVPSDISSKVSVFIKALFNQDNFQEVRTKILSYLNMRIGQQNGKFNRKNGEILAKCLSGN